jgi:ATP synthase protein I
MPQPNDSSDEALRRLDQQLEALQAQRADPGRSAQSLSAGYRLFGEVVGGVLGGLGLGILVDHFAHTQPWGVVGGLVIGAVASVSAAAATASRVADRMRAAAEASPETGSAEKEDDEG